ncbi:MAG TPA: hypothetical protein VF559_02305 [Caulobacteraceae bacterium]
MMFAALAAAMSLMAQGYGSDTGGMVQATKYLCRPTATATVSSPPVCKGGGPLEAQPACFCSGIYTIREEPACNRDGTPAMFPAGHRLSKYENDRLISCIDWQRRRR